MAGYRCAPFAMSYVTDAEASKYHDTKILDVELSTSRSTEHREGVGGTVERRQLVIHDPAKESNPIAQAAVRRNGAQAGC